MPDSFGSLRTGSACCQQRTRSGASYHAAYDHCTANYLTQAGVRNTMIKLGEAGIHGNGHMMMLEKNSDDIARVMREWLMKAVPAKS